MAFECPSRNAMIYHSNKAAATNTIALLNPHLTETSNEPSFDSLFNPPFVGRAVGADELGDGIGNLLTTLQLAEALADAELALYGK